jgi:hypothetical protein
MYNGCENDICMDRSGGGNGQNSSHVKNGSMNLLAVASILLLAIRAPLVSLEFCPFPLHRRIVQWVHNLRLA